MAEFNHIPIVKEKLREQLKQGLPKAFKIVDKLLPDNSKEHAIILKNALDYDVQNPLQILRNAGIDIEPELEEFRQFLAEISGKKIEPKGSKARKAVEGRVPPEVLSIAKALEFSDFSEKVMKKAEKDEDDRPFHQGRRCRGPLPRGQTAEARPEGGGGRD